MKKPLLNILVFVSLLLSTTIASGQNSTTNIDFKIKNFGVYVNGSFSEATITSGFDENNLANSFINATVAISSLSTNNKKRDKHLLEREYFDEPNYKQLKLVSTRIEKSTDKKYLVTGKLTIKKTTKQVVIPVTINESEEGLVMIAEFELNRRDFDVGGSSWVLSNTVKVEVKHIIK